MYFPIFFGSLFSLIFSVFQCSFSKIISFLFIGHPVVVLGYVFCQHILLVFLHLILFWFSLHSWRIFLLGIAFGLTVLCFWHLRNSMPLPHALHGFWWEIYCNYNSFSLTDKMFFSGCFQDFFFVFSFQKFNYDVSWCGSHFVFLQLLKYTCLFVLVNLREVYNHSLKYFSVLNSFPSGTLMITNVRFFSFFFFVFLVFPLPGPLVK